MNGLSVLCGDIQALKGTLKGSVLSIWKLDKISEQWLCITLLKKIRSFILL